MPRKSNKRHRLVVAATSVIYEQGYYNTTLAKVADKAKIPLGNVYYYFKTKHSLASAVINHRMDRLRQELEMVSSAEPDALERLKSLIDFKLGDRDQIARHGCPIVKLATEMAGNDDKDLAYESRLLIQEFICWVEEQFRLLEVNKPKHAAGELITRMFGSSCVSHSLQEPDFFNTYMTRTKAWLEDLVLAGQTSGK